MRPSPGTLLPPTLGLAALLCAAVPAAHAQPYTGPFTGTSVGCFYAAGNAAACDVPAEASSIATLAGLTFTGVSGGFGSTANGAGSLVLGRFNLASHSGNCVGSASIFGCTNAFDGMRFRMFVAFTAPGGTTAFTSVLDGGFISDGFGGVEIDVNSGGPRSITFAGGSFDLDIDDEEVLTVNIDNSATIRGQVTNAVVTPEPATVALMAGGLLGIGGVMARRRREP